MAQQAMPAGEVVLVDHDPAVRAALAAAFAAAGYGVAVFTDAASFVAAARRHTPAAVLIDLQLPDQSGIDVLKDVDAHHYGAPVFIVAAGVDIALAVEAVKSGAYDCLLKPCDAGLVVARVVEAIAVFAARRSETHAADAAPFTFAGQALLTPREREVLGLIAAGASNKEAGRRLGISPRTVEVHRARIMEKIGARNAADLVRIVLGGDGAPRGPARAGMVA
ncbi:MAG: response regulator [Rhodopseudomonas sp.]|nr:response regulator [Rhodopseudomonas sp.]